jgi:hypothetical protein
MRIGQILLILAHLDRRVRNFPVPISHPRAYEAVPFCGFALRPLLKLYNDRLVVLGGIPTANHKIRPAGRTWQFVLYEDPVVI